MGTTAVPAFHPKQAFGHLLDRRANCHAGNCAEIDYAHIVCAARFEMLSTQFHKAKYS